jgi:hypothetical protein
MAKAKKNATKKPSAAQIAARKAAGARLKAMHAAKRSKPAKAVVAKKPAKAQKAKPAKRTPKRKAVAVVAATPSHMSFNPTSDFLRGIV